MKKTILLMMPEHVGLITQIKNNLEYHGFAVCAYSNSYLESNFQYPDLKTHIQAFLPRHLFSRVAGKTSEKIRRQEWAIIQLTQYLENKIFDYALVIRPDLFAENLIQLLRQHTHHALAAYQWDGFDRHPEIVHYVNLFDRFFVFDYNDIIHHDELPLLGITNFYFDMHQVQKKEGKHNTAYFVGSHIQERIEPIILCARALTDLGVNLRFIIATRKTKHKKCYKNEKITFIDRAFDFGTNLDNVIGADILLDFVNPVHQGLSFRIFEALYYQKKLITNNLAIKHYDFYHPDNIFVWDGHDLSGLAEFLSCPVQPVDHAVVEKYAFGNWIKNILDLPPYQKIALPEN